LIIKSKKTIPYESSFLICYSLSKRGMRNMAQKKDKQGQSHPGGQSSLGKQGAGELGKGGQGTRGKGGQEGKGQNSQGKSGVGKQGGGNLGKND
jgi:hypothetical protein